MEVLLVILGIIVVLAFIIIGIYNRLVALRQPVIRRGQILKYS